MIIILAHVLAFAVDLAILYAVLRLSFDIHTAMTDLDRRLDRLERYRGH